jgi:transketolase
MITNVERRKAELHDPRSFDHVGRDVGAKGFVAGQVLAELAEHDDRIVAAAADLKYVTQLAVFEANHPDRFFQFGISERNMISAAAGLATTGLIPYVSTFASFSAILAYENIRTDLAYPGLKVRILATHAGIAMGYFGTSHHATEDIAALRAVANLLILSPADAAATESLLRATVNHDGPIYFRLGRGREDDVYVDGLRAPQAPGAPTVVAEGTDLLLVATGLMVGYATRAARLLAHRGVSATVLDVHTLKPFDAGAVARHAARHQAVVAVEEHNVLGGLGSMTIEALAAAGVGVPVFTHGLRDEYALIGPPSHLYRYYGLDPEGIAAVGLRALSAGHPGGVALWTDNDRRSVMRALGVGA